MGMDDQIITKLIDRMTKIFVTKDDLKDFATKNDLKNFTSKDDLKNLATREDINTLRTEIKSDLKRVENEVKSVGKILVDFMDEIDPKVENHEKRLTKIES